MPDNSPILDLPYIQPSQAQKHVTHNEALRILDALAQLNVASRNLATPPGAPAEGDRYIVPVGAAGAWSGHDAKIAVWAQTIWEFHTPMVGWQAYVVDETLNAVFDGAAWGLMPANLSPSDLQNLDGVGINTTSDAINKLAVASDATLLTHTGDDHRLKINKSTVSDTASLLFQSDWTGHAEMGLTGDTNFSLRVSDDGSTFTDALSADATTGIVTIPQGLNFGNEALSHYEEGIWTPELSFGGSSTGILYDVNTGYYTRIGNLVFLQCAIDLSNKGSATGTAEISGLPYSANPNYFPGEVYFIGGAAGLSTPKCRIIPGPKIRLVNSVATGTVDLDETNFSNASNFKVSIAYFV